MDPHKPALGKVRLEVLGLEMGDMETLIDLLRSKVWAEGSYGAGDGDKSEQVNFHPFLPDSPHAGVTLVPHRPALRPGLGHPRAEQLGLERSRAGPGGTSRRGVLQIMAILMLLQVTLSSKNLTTDRTVVIPHNLYSSCLPYPTHGLPPDGRTCSHSIPNFSHELRTVNTKVVMSILLVRSHILLSSRLLSKDKTSSPVP